MSVPFKPLLLSFLLLPSVLGAAPAARQLSPEEAAARAERRARFNERTGGLVEKPGNGVVVVANAQSRIGVNEVTHAASLITREFRIAQKVVACRSFDITTAKGEVETNKASALVFVVNEPSLPMSLIASEARWAVVNVAPLLADRPSEGKLRLRYRKMFMRVASALLGAGASNYKLSIMQNVSGLDDLDAISGLGLDPQSLMAVLQRLQKMGMAAPKLVPYLKACQEGWAPAPTNDYQKAVWERVRSEKERGPANGLRIEPRR